MESMPVPVSSRLIAAGDVELPVAAWLKQHGCKISECSGLTVIELPSEAEAIMDNGVHSWAFTISFCDALGEQSDRIIDVDWCIDARQSRITLRAI